MDKCCKICGHSNGESPLTEMIHCIEYNYQIHQFSVACQNFTPKAEEKKMMARPKYDRTSKKYNVAVNHHGEEILVGEADGIFVKYSYFDTKQLAINYINSKEKLKLAKNLLEMITG